MSKIIFGLTMVCFGIAMLGVGIRMLRFNAVERRAGAPVTVAGTSGVSTEHTVIIPYSRQYTADDLRRDPALHVDGKTGQIVSGETTIIVSNNQMYHSMRFSYEDYVKNWPNGPVYVGSSR